jgi:COMPASS component SWD2
MCPINDNFISCSKDKTVRLWDLQAATCTGQIPVSDFAAANFDPQGIVFGVGTKGTDVQLFDSRQYQKGPFATVQLDQTPPQEEIVGK